MTDAEILVAMMAYMAQLDEWACDDSLEDDTRAKCEDAYKALSVAVKKIEALEEW